MSFAASDPMISTKKGLILVRYNIHLVTLARSIDTAVAWKVLTTLSTHPRIHSYTLALKDGKLPNTHANIG